MDSAPGAHRAGSVTEEIHDVLAFTYANFVSEMSEAEERLFLQYIGPRDDFDIIIVGSGDRRRRARRRSGRPPGRPEAHPGARGRVVRLSDACLQHLPFPEREPGAHFGCDTFWQGGNSESAELHRREAAAELWRTLDLLVGADPAIQDWELEFFPPSVRKDLSSGLLNRAGDTMNESRSMGSTAQAIVATLRQSPLAADFFIEETPRALHQPYLRPDGTPTDRVLHRADGRVQHRRAAHQPGRPDARA